MPNRLELTVLNVDGSRSTRSIDVMSARGAGFCSRDRRAARELSEARRGQGLSWTSKEYWTYRIGRNLVTTANSIEVQGPLTGGEVEAVAVFSAQDMFIGVGSDHSDGEIYPLFLEKPKQMCPHALSPRVWKLDDLADHWDDLLLESEICVGANTVAYQRFNLGELVPLKTWIDLCGLAGAPDATVFYCGTGRTVAGLAESVTRLGLPAQTAHGGGDEFRMRMYDPVLNREIRHAYRVEVLGDDLEERRSR